MSRDYGFDNSEINQRRLHDVIQQTHFAVKHGRLVTKRDTQQYFIVCVVNTPITRLTVASLIMKRS